MKGGSDRLQRVYQARFSEEAKKAKARVWNVLVRSYFQHWTEPSDTVLDIGCGFGEFLNNIRCEHRIGVDLNPDMLWSLLGRQFLIRAQKPRE